MLVAYYLISNMQKDIICDQLGPKELDWLINPVKFHGEMACQKQGVRGPIHVGPTTGLWPHHPRKVYMVIRSAEEAFSNANIRWSTETTA